MTEDHDPRSWLRRMSGRGDRRRLLDIYVGDHWAGAGAGTRLARRLHENNRDSPWAAELGRIADAVTEDDRTLAQVRDALDNGRGDIKRVLGLVGERIARLKPNGRVVSYSPLSRVVECEALLSGVAGKHRLWVALGRNVVGVPELAEFDFDLLEQRAEHQIETLRRLHREFAAVAFGDGAGASATTDGEGRPAGRSSRARSRSTT